MRLVHSLLIVAFSVTAPLMLASCGDDDDIRITRPTAHLDAAMAVYAESVDLTAFILPDSFMLTTKQLEAAMAHEAVKTIALLKPEYQEALATDALNFTDQRRRT